MSTELANWLGIAFIFGAGSFFAGWTISNFYWRRWARGQDLRRELMAEHLAKVNERLNRKSSKGGNLIGGYDAIMARMNDRPDRG